MKIAIFHELNYGGARRTVNDFAKTLKKNHLVDLYLVDAEISKEEKFFSGVFFYKFIPKKWTGKNWKTRLYKDTIELYKLYKLHKRIAKDVNSGEYDLVFVHPSKYTQAPFVLQFLKKKTIYYCQEPLRIVYDPQIASIEKIPLLKRPYEFVNRIIRKYIDRKNISCASYILVNSEYSQKTVKSAYGRESIVCYLGVDTNLFKPLEVKKIFDVLFIGNKDQRSRYKLFCDAVLLLKKNPKIYIKLRTSFNIDDSNFVKLYNSSRMVITLTKSEPFGLIPLEAMAWAVPIIAINEGGNKETIVDGKTGYLVEEDPFMLSDTIKNLLENPRMALDIGYNGRRNILHHWSLEKRSSELIRIFNEFIQKSTIKYK